MISYIVSLHMICWKQALGSKGSAYEITRVKIKQAF